jgi:uncharacterized phage protein (TIGR01671 family)
MWRSYNCFHARNSGVIGECKLRQIKFRGLLQSGVFIYGSYVTDGKDYHAILRENPDNSLEMLNTPVIPKSVGQLTGIQDKYDVDIYEGDIVAILFTDWASQSKDDTRSLEEYKHSREKVFPICFNKGCFQISELCKYGDDFSYGDISCGPHGHIRVIGNIHQNPELLEQAK